MFYISAERDNPLLDSPPEKKFAVKVIFPAGTGLQPQIRGGFAAQQEAETWMEKIRHEIAERYCCSERRLLEKGFQFLVYQEKTDYGPRAQAC